MRKNFVMKMPVAPPPFNDIYFRINIVIYALDGIMIMNVLSGATSF